MKTRYKGMTIKQKGDGYVVLGLGGNRKYDTKTGAQSAIRAYRKASK